VYTSRSALLALAASLAAIAALALSLSAATQSYQAIYNLSASYTVAIAGFNGATASMIPSYSATIAGFNSRWITLGGEHTAKLLINGTLTLCSTTCIPIAPTQAWVATEATARIAVLVMFNTTVASTQSIAVPLQTTVPGIDAAYIGTITLRYAAIYRINGTDTIVAEPASPIPPLEPMYLVAYLGNETAPAPAQTIPVSPVVEPIYAKLFGLETTTITTTTSSSTTTSQSTTTSSSPPPETTTTTSAKRASLSSMWGWLLVALLIAVAICIALARRSSIARY